MKFIYNKKIDKECRQRVNDCEDIFGEEKKTDKYPVSDQIIRDFNDKWSKEIDSIFKEGIEKIFNNKIPQNFICYINSTPYSMDIENGISISASSLNVMIRMVCHEANHYMFRKSKYKDKYFPNMDIEEAKEIFTIINNIYFKDIMETSDNGWKKFWSERKEFLERWKVDNL